MAEEDPTIDAKPGGRLRASLGELGATFGARFEVERAAAGGGMGEIYEAVDRTTGKKIAIKVITGLAGPAERARFAAECEVLERLSHPAIVEYVDHGVTPDGEPYLAMEWLIGESLAHRLEAGPLAVNEVVLLGERITSALVHAHAAGVLHRDLKPSNIMLVGGQVADAHLIDFGVAKQSDRDLTSTGQMIGTPGYMAPEQVRGEKGIGAAVDVFALGCVLYRALTGRDAFGGQEVMEVLARLLLEEPTPIDELTPGVPPRLARLVESMLAKEAARRPADAAIVGRELAAIQHALTRHDEAALRARPATGATSPVVRPAASSPPHLPSRRRGIAIAIAGASAASVVALVVAVLALRRGGDAPASTPCDDTSSAGCAASCEAGDGEACHRHARALHARDSHEAARAADGRACRLGHDQGCYELATSLVKLAKPKPAGDPRRAEWLAEAERTFATACDRAHAESCRELGKQLSKGYGVLPPDPPRAFALVARSCELDSVVGCNALRDMAADTGNGATDELRARAREVRARACARLRDLRC